MPKENIKKIRKQIDKVDDQIISLLDKRIILIKKISNFKSINKLKDSQRETKIINRLSNQSDLPKKFIKQIYFIIFSYSIKELKKILKK